MHVHVTPARGERSAALVEVFRVRDGKITEHWDVIQPVPEKPVPRQNIRRDERAVVW